MNIAADLRTADQHCGKEHPCASCGRGPDPAGEQPLATPIAKHTPTATKTSANQLGKGPEELILPLGPGLKASKGLAS